MQLVQTIMKDHPHVAFRAGAQFVWSPHDSSVTFDDKALRRQEGLWSLLHELGHAELEHTDYTDDLHLLMLEVDAWRKAKSIAKQYDIVIDQDYIEDCIQGYRNWLYERSKCIECGIHSFQVDFTRYLCYSCGAEWKVSASRMCQIKKRRV